MRNDALSMAELLRPVKTYGENERCSPYVMCSRYASASASADQGRATNAAVETGSVAPRSTSEIWPLARRANGPPPSERARPVIRWTPVGNATKGLSVTLDCAPAVAATHASAAAPSKGQYETRSTTD